MFYRHLHVFAIRCQALRVIMLNLPWPSHALPILILWLFSTSIGKPCSVCGKKRCEKKNQIQDGKEDGPRNKDASLLKLAFLHVWTMLRARGDLLAQLSLAFRSSKRLGD